MPEFIIERDPTTNLPVYEISVIHDIIDTGNDLLVHSLHKSHVSSVAFSPDGKTFASGSHDRHVKVWDASGSTFKLKGTVELSVTQKWAKSVAFSPDGKTLAIGSYDPKVQLWDVSGYTPEHKGALTGHIWEVTSLAFSPDGNTLASGSDDNSIKLWKVETNECKATLEGHSRANRECICFANKLPSFKKECPVAGHMSAVRSVTFSPDGNTLASGSDDNSIKLWGVSGDTPVLKGTYKGHSRYNPQCMCYPNGYYQSNRECPVTGHMSAVRSVTFSPDGNTLASGSADNTIKLWKVSGDTLELKYTLTGHIWQVTSLAFSPDGNTLASGSDDSTVKLWDVSGNTPMANRLKRILAHPEEVHSVAWSPDGKTIACGCTKKLMLWNRIPKYDYRYIDLRVDDAKKLAFLMITHQKLGHNSRFKELPEDILKQIYGPLFDIKYLDW